MNEVENFFRNKAIDLYVIKREQGLECEIAFNKTLLQLHDIALLSISRASSNSEINKIVATAKALLDMKKDKRLSQKMEDAFVFSNLGNVKPQHLKLIMQ